jgi:prepilin-type processing-associated H-X9-DG protein
LKTANPSWPAITSLEIYFDNRSSLGRVCHGERANVVFYDGQTATEQIVPDSLNTRHPNEIMGWLPLSVASKP